MYVQVLIIQLILLYAPAWGKFQLHLSLQKSFGQVVGISGLPEVEHDVIVHLKH